MEIKKLAKNTLKFGINRLIEAVCMATVITGLLLLSALLSFWPNDPNFIFPDNKPILNILGFRGSFTADLFFQSFGRIALLIPFSFIFTGINIFLNKNILLTIESLFYIVLYLLLGSLFFSFFYPNSFELYVNGSGGFIGKYLMSNFLVSLINLNIQIS